VEMDPVLETCILNMLQTVDNGQHSIHIINQPLSQTLRELIFIDVLDLLYEIFLLEVDLSVNINEGICYYSP
jgi:hypothetical protein